MAKLTDSALRRLTGLKPFPQPPLLPLRYPVVLMHGFGLLAGLRREGHLHEEALNLRQHGVRAYAPNVTSYNTVRVRSEMWLDRFERILDETKASHVTVIAHSMGGLDARYLLHEHDLHEVVPVLVTVSTPHHGTSAAEYILEQPARIRNFAANLCNWMGEAALDDSTSDFMHAISELTPAHICEQFNSTYPDHPDVQYWSYAGEAGKGTDVPINPFMKITNSVLFDREGVNDGLVSVQSAKWGVFKGVIDADHPQQVGLQGLPGHRFDSNAFYLSIAEELSKAGY